MGLGKIMFGLIVLMVGVAWDSFVVGGVVATNAFSPPPGSTFDYGLFGLYVILGALLAAIGIFIVITDNGRNKLPASRS